MTENVAATDSVRERKRRETQQRIIEASLAMFIERGFDGVTIDEIAAASAISRRTFFHYFATKEDVLMVMHEQRITNAIAGLMEGESAEQSPLQAAHNCLYKLASRFETKQSVAIDRLFQSTEALRSRKEMAHVEMEHVLVEAMRKIWPDADRLDELRTSAMIAMGALRLAIADLRDDEQARPIDYHLQRVYKALDESMQSGTADPMGI